VSVFYRNYVWNAGHNKLMDETLAKAYHLSKANGKLPQKQYGLEIDKLFNFKTVKDEKKHIQSCSDCRDSQRIR
jgi:hypothetical protein